MWLPESTRIPHADDNENNGKERSKAKQSKLALPAHKNNAAKASNEEQKLQHGRVGCGRPCRTQNDEIPRTQISGVANIQNRSIDVSTCCRKRSRRIPWFPDDLFMIHLGAHLTSRVSVGSVEEIQ